MLTLARAALRRKAAPAAAIGLVFVLAGTAVAGAGYGGAIQIGLDNLASSYQTNLLATAANKTALAVTNHATTGVSRAIFALSKSPYATAVYAQNWYGSALQLVTPTDKPPMIVNSSVRVANLNAERAGVADNASALAGMPASGYQRRVSGTCAVDQQVTAVNADGTVACGADSVDGGDAQTLDGLDSTAFMGSRQAALVSTVADATTVKTAIATCPRGTKVIGGGSTFEGDEGSKPVVESSWADTDTSWAVRARNLAPTSWSLTTQAICA